ncbi:MAG: hypothetical protein GY788_03015 [bacterium]|nr:hypothetical protein [bacterium]
MTTTLLSGHRPALVFHDSRCDVAHECVEADLTCDEIGFSVGVHSMLTDEAVRWMMNGLNVWVQGLRMYEDPVFNQMTRTDLDWTWSATFSLTLPDGQFRTIGDVLSVETGVRSVGVPLRGRNAANVEAFVDACAEVD